MFLLIAGLSPITMALAQEKTPENSSGRRLDRLGDSPAGQELDLDLTVPSEAIGVEKTVDGMPEDDHALLIEQHLADGARAMREGRVDQPPRDCAWFHYRAALDLDPESAAAKEGLEAVQKAMIDRARAVAKDLDFESAGRILDDAALVLEAGDRIGQAQEDIRAFRTGYAEQLETRAVQAMDEGNFAQAERVLIELIALGGADDLVSQLRRRMEEARLYGGFRPGQIIRDHFLNTAMWTPDSVVVLASSFMMGSSAFEDGRKDNEGPQHRVSFRRGFAIGRTEVTVKEFRYFVDKTGYKTDAERHGFSVVYNHTSGRLMRRDSVNWKNDYEGREADDAHPVVHVSWNDATAYVQWLARGTGKPYRLPSEAEFEYAVRGGSKSRYWWGDGGPSRVVENLTGENDISRGRRQWSTFFEGYGDGHWGPAPVASFEANPYGLHDIAGNVGEWVRDCWHDSYIRAPADGSAWLNPGCKLRVMRGGYWASAPDQARSAYRLSAQPDRRDARVGFRIARDL
jgi:formylglycine-generating enzyme required for sulfatase activity